LLFSQQGYHRTVPASAQIKRKDLSLGGTGISSLD